MSVSPKHLARTRLRRPLPRMSSDQELAFLSRGQELQLRGKHVVDATALAEYATEAQRIPGLRESAERVTDFFDDSESGNWVDGSPLFRVARTDQGNRIKRIWRDFEHRVTTLRDYLRGEVTETKDDDCVRFTLPASRLSSPKAFLSGFRYLIAGLDRVSRLVLDEGFSIAGFRERSGSIVLKAESPRALRLAHQIIEHFRWFREQSEDVQRLEDRKEISEEYAKAAKSLAAAQLRHLRVLVEATVRDHVGQVPDAQFEKAVTTTTEYVGVLENFVKEGAEVVLPSRESDDAGSRAA